MDVKVDAFDRQAWDAYVSRSPNGHFMQSYAWGEMQQASGWDAHRLGLVDGGALRATALLLSRRIPATATRVFYAPRGPTLDLGDHEAGRALADAMHAFIRRRGGAFLRADPYLEESPSVDAAFERVGFQRVPRNWSHWNGPKYVFWLDLDKDEDHLLHGLDGNCRREVRGGYGKGVAFTRGGADDLDEFYRLMASMSHEKGIAVHDGEYFQRLYRTLGASCDVQLFLARCQDKVISVGMSVKYGRTAWLLYAASDSAYFRLRINRTVQWEMIRWAHALGCTRYDFRGTATGDPPSEQDPGYGVYTFKKSFGPEFIRLAGYYDLVGSRPVYRLLRLGEEKGLPVAYRARVWFDERRAAR